MSESISLKTITSSVYHYGQQAVNFAFKTKAENKKNSFFPMSITKKVYSAANNRLYKIFMIASMVLPLIALLEFTAKGMFYMTRSPFAALKNRNLEPSYEWSSRKVGSEAATVAALIAGMIAYSYLTSGSTQKNLSKGVLEDISHEDLSWDAKGLALGAVLSVSYIGITRLLSRIMQPKINMPQLAEPLFKDAQTQTEEKPMESILQTMRRGTY